MKILVKKWLGIAQVLLAGAGFGFLGIFARLAFREGFTVGELLFWRFVFASLILWTFALFFKRKLIHLNAKQILICFFLGVFGYAVFSSLYFASIKGISVALAAMLLFTFPIFVSLGEHFIHKDRINAKQWLSLFLACLGLTLLLWGDLTIKTYAAVFFGLSAAITYSVYVLVSGRVQKTVEPLSSSLYVITSAAFGLYIFHRPELTQILHFNQHQYLLVIGIAIFCSIGPMTLFLAGLQKMKSSQASILVMIEPVVATLAAWTILGESLSLRQSFGAATVILALILNSMSK